MATYKTIINKICENIHSGLIDFTTPRTKASKPTLASSEFITNKQQGDWAEDVLFRAINNYSLNIVAVKYGKSDDLVAGDPGFDELYNDYQTELDLIGKRPDILLFRKEDFDKDLGYDISSLGCHEIDNYVAKAIAGVEVRSSAFLFNKYNEEVNRIIERNTQRILNLKNIILIEYSDLLSQKRPDLITTLQQIDATTMDSIDFRVTSWHSSQRLQELSSMLSEIKKCLKIIQKRNSLSITPKVEDLKVVYKWIMKYNVPHFYVQVFFDKVFGISFQHILELIANPDLEDVKYYIEQDSKNQNKTTIKIPSHNGVCLAQTVYEPEHHSVRKELNRGRLLYYVKFNGGKACLDVDNFENLFGYKL